MKILYMSNTDKEFSRTKIYMDALREQGIEIVECFSTEPGLRKFRALYKKHRSHADDYDILVVGYRSPLLVPFARLITRKPIIYDAACTLYEGVVLSRGQYLNNPLKRFGLWLMDWLAYIAADIILLEAQSQIEYYKSLLRVRGKKCRLLLTGTNERVFYVDPTVQKLSRFTVLFRGKYNLESGIRHVIAAGKILQHENIHFRILSPGYTADVEVTPNVEIDARFLELDELRERMLECHVSLGQLEDHPRLGRTIPHKAFETMHMNLPFITARTKGVRELYTEDVDSLMVNAGDPTDLAQKILYLRDNPDLGERLAAKARSVYEERCSSRVLATQFIEYANLLTQS